MKRPIKSLSYYLATATGFAISFVGIISPFAYYQVVKANDVISVSPSRMSFSTDSKLISTAFKLPLQNDEIVNPNKTNQIIESSKLNEEAKSLIETSSVSELNVIDIPNALPRQKEMLETRKELLAKELIIDESPKDVTRFADRLRDGKKVKMVATAYCLNGRTASGVFSKYGIIAADPKYLPIGSIVRIGGAEYTGLYSVLDTGAKIKGRKIDIYLTSGKEAIQFGRREVTLEVLRYGWNPQVCNDVVLAEQKKF
jgi:3D (Asp-Asp-Asp) domain-containing protein